MLPPVAQYFLIRLVLLLYLASCCKVSLHRLCFILLKFGSRCLVFLLQTYTLPPPLCLLLLCGCVDPWLHGHMTGPRVLILLSPECSDSELAFRLQERKSLVLTSSASPFCLLERDNRAPGSRALRAEESPQPRPHVTLCGRAPGCPELPSSVPGFLGHSVVPNDHRGPVTWNCQVTETVQK